MNLTFANRQRLEAIERVRIALTGESETHEAIEELRKTKGVSLTLDLLLRSTPSLKAARQDREEPLKGCARSLSMVL